MLSSIFIAASADVGADTNPQDHPNADIKPVDTLRLEALAKLVKASAGRLDPIDTSGEQFVIPVGDELAAKLATLDRTTIGTLAASWAEMEAWGDEPPSAADAVALLTQMCALAAQAKCETKRVYLWLSL